MSEKMEDGVKKAAVLAAVVLSFFASTAFCQEEKIKWQENLAAAMKKAAEEGKIVFADFTGREN